MSKEFDENLTDPQISFLHSVINLNIWKMEISWDLDQTLLISENPVKEFCDKEFGTNYKSRRITGWDSISKWLVEDGIMPDVKTAVAYEGKLWTDPNILSVSKPNPKLQALSYAAYLRGIPQQIVTVRIAELKETTLKSVEVYFPWIEPRNVFMNENPDIKGLVYKIGQLSGKLAQTPNLVHFDDDMKLTMPLIGANPGIGLIGILYPGESVNPKNFGPNQTFIGRDELNGLIYY